MAGNLRSRLSRMRKLAVPEASPIARDDGGAPKDMAASAASAFAGWTTLEDGLRFRDTGAPMTGIASDGDLRLAAFSRRLPPASVPVTELAFFDLETTGLSGGAGTIAFLAAIGRLDPCGIFTVRQYFIDDYPAEPRFVERVVRELGSATAIVTYNGASFDIPLLATRCSMNRVAPLGSILHIDALHAARRLWKRPLGDCSLSSVESSILGVTRADDIPGAEVPEAWFDYVKRGRADRLARVFDHNRQDVVSLASLAFLTDALAGGLEPVSVCDMVGLAELVSRVDEKRAEQTLRSALEQGDLRATRPLMRLLRAQGRMDERAALVPSLPDDAAGLFSKSVYLERVMGDIDGAISLSERSAAVARSGGVLQARAAKRSQRLERRSGDGLQSS